MLSDVAEALNSWVLGFKFLLDRAELLFGHVWELVGCATGLQDNLMDI